MKTPLNIIGIIPARGGSVRVPLKNIRLLAGKPLISYIISAALQSRYLRRVIVSTDHPEIKKIALQYGAEVPYGRPKSISGSAVPTISVIKHVVELVEKEEGKKIDIVVTLQPTSPFCQSKDIDECIELLLKHKTASSAFSAVEIRERPEWMFRLNKRNCAEPYIPGAMEGKRTVRKFYEKLFIPNGGIYITTRNALFKENAMITKRTALYVMPKERSLDIDEEIDFRFAELLMKKSVRGDYL